MTSVIFPNTSNFSINIVIPLTNNINGTAFIAEPNPLKPVFILSKFIEVNPSDNIPNEAPNLSIPDEPLPRVWLTSSIFAFKLAASADKSLNSFVFCLP